MRSTIRKISISLPNTLQEFVNNYQQLHRCKSRSEVITIALYLLQQKQLEECYQAANSELDCSFETAASDGLDYETW